MAVPTTNAKTILIIDDSPEDRYFYQNYLLKNTDSSYQILEAEDGEAGLLCLQQNHCDVILLDFNLPDMDGLEVLAALNQTTESSIPVIMLTGQGDEATAVNAMKQGVYDYLIKQQVTANVLQSAVRNALTKFELQKRLDQSQKRQALISTIALRIRQSLDLDQVLRRATIEVHQLLACDRISIYQFAPNMKGFVVAESVNAGWTSALKQEIVDTCFQSQAGQLYAKGKVSVINDIALVQLSPCYSELLRQFEVKASIVVPLLVTQNVLSDRQESESLLSSSSSPDRISKLWGVLIAHQCDRPRTWQGEEIELIEALATQLALAIQQAEMLSQTQIALKREHELRKLKSHILSTISHEYQSPLASVLAAAATLKMHQKALSTAKQGKLLDMIAERARHMSNLVNDMLIMNQREIGAVPFQPIYLDIEKFLAKYINEYCEQATDRLITFEITGNVPPFYIDPKALQQIVSNLLSNAIKYSLPNSKVEVRLYGQPSQIILVIQDYGIGIPAADQADLFQPFHRGSNVESLAGTGLGLSIVKACVEMNGGTIACQSELGQGTRITVGLPRANPKQV
ncbi:GAF sensor hybrid histidine kinase [Thalassoporum mexicanum PCC 7367]|uniref:hybrid sensor histidine kinase/response regulator n=1 Tax=Thalassoporum mexicanum TaxID=3457544 RepID=UPI00029FB143|nr:ATP-binding protein [Pseudanabaena sp. PCC 7367]AFY70390.1 GAF sensor hybrid histidine kinase [Pseudanabaena sp. PCC 7367]